MYSKFYWNSAYDYYLLKANVDATGKQNFLSGMPYTKIFTGGRTNDIYSDEVYTPTISDDPDKTHFRNGEFNPVFNLRWDEYKRVAIGDVCLGHSTFHDVFTPNMEYIDVLPTSSDAVGIEGSNYYPLMYDFTGFLDGTTNYPYGGTGEWLPSEDSPGTNIHQLDYTSDFNCASKI